jgi:hypothetical protein
MLSVFIDDERISKFCPDKYYTGNVKADLISPTTVNNVGKIDMGAENAYREQFENFIHLGKPILIRNHSFYVLGIVSDIKKDPIFGDDCGWGIWTYTFTFTEVDNGEDLKRLIANNLTYIIETE